MLGTVYFGSDDVPDLLFPHLFLHALLFNVLPANMVNSLWFKWKSLRLPWRKMFIVGESVYCRLRFMRLKFSGLANQLPGEDLAGNTFWVFKDVANASRMRRIVKFDPRTHYDEVQVTRTCSDTKDAHWACHRRLYRLRKEYPTNYAPH